MTRRVLILEPQLKQYRRSFVQALAARLAEHDVVLTYAYSEPNRTERAKADGIELPGLSLKLPGMWLFDERVFVQWAWRPIRDADLVIMEQGNKHVFNYVLLALSALGRKRVGYWGHGYNHQARRAGLSERLKRRLLTHVDWWFAYTDGVARYLRSNGVDPQTISILQNTVDSRPLANAVDALDEPARLAVRARLGIPAGAPVGMFCGSLYADKRLGFMIAAAKLVREQHPDFALIVIGDGPERETVARAAAEHPFVHYIGSVFDVERAEYFAISDMFLMPGLVGLAIVDAFAAGLPVLTTDVPIHSPEIEYLRAGENGEITAPDVRTYANAVSRLISDREQRTRMSAAARATAATLTLEHMVDRFADGVVRCLEQSR